MNGLPLHPAIVHIPLGVAIVVPLVALVGLWLLFRRGGKSGWLIAVALQAVVVVGGAVAMNTGEADEEVVERVVSEAAIEAHEEAAEVFVWVAGAVLALAGIALLLPASKGRWVAAVASAGTVAVLALGLQVGHAGGELVYRHGAAQAHIPTGAAADTATPGADERRERDEPRDDD